MNKKITLLKGLDIIFLPLKPGLLSVITGIIILFNSFSVTAQSNGITITGSVKDDNNLPIPGATILVKDTKIAAVSTSNGTYKITLPNETSSLIYRFIGFETKEEKVGKRRVIDVILKEQINSLSQVVVVGYGSQERKDITGSVSSIKGDDLQKTTNVSINQAMQGRAAGVDVISSDGSPGGEVNITIRGGSSISASNDPLYIIDGFALFGGSNLNLSASDIESIEILKDASATAIYGSRGANGVVIITTKNAKAGKFSVNYDFTNTYQSISRKLPVINALQYAEVQHHMWSTPPGSGNETRGFANWPTFKDSTTLNWQDVIYETGTQQNHSLSFSGGTEALKISGAFGYLNQKGIVIGTGFSRYTGKLNAITNISKKLSNGTNIYLSGTENSGPFVAGPGGIIQGTIVANPLVFNGDLDELLRQDLIGGLGTNNDVSNPLLELTTPKLRSNSFSSLINTYFTYNLSKNLVFKTSGAVNLIKGNFDRFYPLTTNIGRLYNGQANVGQTNTVDWLNENTLTFNKKFNSKHNTSSLIGFTTQKNVINSNSITVRDFPIQSLGSNNLSLGNIPLQPISNKVNTGLQSFLGRINYDYNKKYYLTLTLRADGSSKFVNDKWGFFPSGAFSWRVNEEKFIKDINAISNLKFRASLGTTGNQSVAAYSSATRFNPANAIVNNINVIGLSPSQLGNSDLRWERNTQGNLGLDLGFFKNRVTITVDAYRKRSKDLLLNAPISLYSGYTSVFRNIGNARVQGLEFDLNTVNLDGKLKWTSSFNISFVRSKVLSLTQDQTQIALGVLDRKSQNYLIRVGEPLGAIYGYINDGIFNTQEELVTSPQQAGISQLGFRKYKDVGGPNGIPDGKIDAFDQTIIGNGNPLFRGGFSNTLKYKGFDLDLLFTFSYGNDILNAGRVNLERPSVFKGGLAVMMDRWTPERPQANQPKWGPIPTELDVNTSYLVEDGSYVRLKTLIIGYTLPKQLLSKAFIKNLRVFCSGENLITLSNYSGYDPEVNYLGSIITPGADLYSYPKSRIFSFGIQSNF